MRNFSFQKKEKKFKKMLFMSFPKKIGFAKNFRVQKIGKCFAKN
jgi:hypothetical protein